ncbi:hypothetical protein EW146_g2282 [Bondarzewia mesenterica]|uniref:Pre-mRNA-splicing factor CWC24 n=1 Tax=Bondarzewia mesenterica TaxID=1095465 RepID=A0A4V3XFU2_9AGAM|nr:hypothetical protein EW146_g2282 [Bondarzewia mesenterica]
MTSTEEVKVPFFKKKRARPTTTRQRSASPPAAALTVPVASSSKSEVVLPSRKGVANLLSAGTKRTASQRRADEYDAEQDTTQDGPGMNWSSTGGHVNAALEILQGDEAEEMLAKKVKRAGSEEEEGPNDGLYRGQKAYKTHIKKSQEVPKAMRVGPQRSNTSTIRTVTIVDYQPDVCKDYKETGFCGFGDTCKFLHDRGTYLAGWQLDKLAANPKKQVEDQSDSDDDSDEEDIPFACILCRKPYTEPVVTRCGHYFCSACAIKRFAKTPKCAACGAPTGGIFNRAEKIMEKIKKRQEKEKGEGNDDEHERKDIRIEGLGEESGGEGSDRDNDDG